jgi:Icc-related predicted phosphoesterase
MTNPLIVGDVRARMSDFEQLCQRNPGRDIIQVGDFGFQRQHDWLIVQPYSVKVNFGNHDYLPYVNYPHSLGNFAQPAAGLFTVRGAVSIDRMHRTEGFDWFADEELTSAEGQAVLEAYELTKPEIVISHDAPQLVRERAFRITESSNTSQLLQALLQIHQPRLWVHGHHHLSRTTELNGTKFVSLAELEVYSL